MSNRFRKKSAAPIIRYATWGLPSNAADRCIHSDGSPIAPPPEAATAAAVRDSRSVGVVEDVYSWDAST
jgi:hypothetical protein